MDTRLPQGLFSSALNLLMRTSGGCVSAVQAEFSDLQKLPSCSHHRAVSLPWKS